MKITDDFSIFSATIYGEAANQSEASWRAIAHVIMNRVGTREWKKLRTAKDVIEKSGFDAFTDKTNNYKYAYKLISTTKMISEISDEKLKRLASAVLPVFQGKDVDPTEGSVLYYSPLAQTKLHAINPAVYREKPKWDFSKLVKVDVLGCEDDDFFFYRYRKQSSVSLKVVDQLNRPVSKANISIAGEGLGQKLMTDSHGVIKDLIVDIEKMASSTISFVFHDSLGNAHKAGAVQLDKFRKYFVTLVSPNAKIRSSTTMHQGSKGQQSGKRAASEGRPVEKRNDNGHPIVSIGADFKSVVGDVVDGLLFPLPFRPDDSYHESPRSFGSNRAAGRKHAGIDLYAPVGTPIRAMAEGRVLAIYGFHGETWAIDIEHGNFIARYGEVGEKTIKVTPGVLVKRGDNLAEVGLLMLRNRTTGKVEPHTKSMLHLEFFRTTLFPTGKNRLTNRNSSPFQRRGDLMDPTGSIDVSSFN